MDIKDIVIIICCTLFFMAAIYIKWIARQDMKSFEHGDKGGILRQPKFYIYFPFTMMCVSFVFSILGPIIDTEGLLLCLFLGLPSAFILALVTICFSLWKVEIRKEEFIYRNYFGITKRYLYKDLQYDFNGRKYAFMMNGKTVFAMPGWIEGGNKLKKSYTKYRLKVSKEEETTISISEE